MDQTEKYFFYFSKQQVLKFLKNLSHDYQTYCKNEEFLRAEWILFFCDNTNLLIKNGNYYQDQSMAHRHK